MTRRWPSARALVPSVVLWPLLAYAEGAPEPPVVPAPSTETATVERCVSEHDQARPLRLDKRWSEARGAMQHCSDTACPIAIRSDCEAWLAELEQALPSLVVVVERDDQGHGGVHLALDERDLDVPEQLTPMEVLPGRHRLRFTLASYAPVELVITLDEGEKNRLVRVRFEHEKLRATPASTPATVPPPRTVSSRPIPLGAYLLGAGSVAAFGTSTALLVSALSSRATAREDCAPGCPASERESIETRLLVADIAGGAGFALAALAVLTYVQRPTKTEYVGAHRLNIALTGEKAALWWQGSF